MISRNRFPVRCCLAAALLLFCTRPSASALATNLPAVADTALRSSAAASNFGAATNLAVGVANFGSPKNHALFKFDLTGIPTNAVIASATLRLILIEDPTPPASFDVSRLLQDWGEGDKDVDPKFGGAPATAGEATWDSRFHPDVAWASPGGQAGTDYASTPSATVLLSGHTNDISSPGLLADVQVWMQNPGTNFGWIVAATGEATATGKLIGSRENPGREPALLVEYSLSAPATPPVLFDPALTGNQFRFSLNTESNRTYVVEFSDSLDPAAWNVWTNLAAAPEDATVHLTNDLAPGERYFRARVP